MIFSLLIFSSAILCLGTWALSCPKEDALRRPITSCFTALQQLLHQLRPLALCFCFTSSSCPSCPAKHTHTHAHAHHICHLAISGFPYVPYLAFFFLGWSYDLRTGQQGLRAFRVPTSVTLFVPYLAFFSWDGLMAALGLRTGQQGLKAFRLP